MTLVYELLEDFRYQGIGPLTWHAYPGARHEILNETNRDEVQADLLRWLESLV
jgi:alpha-beta hydrolase superfamily lysophospholipase